MDTAHFLAWFVRVDFNRTKIEIILSGILRKYTHINKPLHLNNHHPPPQSKNIVNLITYTFHIYQGTYTAHVCTHPPDALNILKALQSDSVNSNGMLGCWELSHSWLHVSLTTTLWERGHHHSTKTELWPRGTGSTARERQQVPEQELKSSLSDSEFHSVSKLL